MVSCCFRIFLSALLAISLGGEVTRAQTPLTSSRPDGKALLNLEQKCLTRISAEMWTLTHAYESKEEVDKLLEYLIDFAPKSLTGESKQIDFPGVSEVFKENLSKFLDSKDDSVRAFSALALACTGDRSYSPTLAKIINERDESFSDRFAPRPSIVRGRAAVALGLLQATEYKRDIIKLLKSKNEYDRSGAISALGEMHALEFTNEIVSVLIEKDFAFDDDDSPIYFLIGTKQAGKYKQELVRAMLGESRTKVTESAAYALAAIGATEHAKDIAQLLKSEFRQGAAAKALALMGSTQHSDEIAKLLAARSGSTRNAAMVSLAILDSKKHIPAIERIHTNDPESYVRAHAAIALLLLGKPQAYREFRAETDVKGPPKLSEIDFHYFVLERLKSYNEKLIANLNAPETNR